MSRLDSFLRRMNAQRTLLDAAADLIKDVDGPIVDLGIGNGRTFDHLCALFEGRHVFAFDHFVQSAVGVLPPAERLVIGDIRDTLPVALPRLGARAALIHNDLGSADPTGNAATAAWLAPAIESIARHNAVVVTSFPLPFSSFQALALPGTVRPGRYHLLRLTLPPH
ncbi:MAG: class I SAM-dependent methyltransferase [Pseudomonadota bacterium]